MDRPYINFTGQDLLREFETRGDDVAVLERLRDELCHRTTRAMRGLLMDVEDALRQKGSTRPAGRKARPAREESAPEARSAFIRACSPDLNVPARWIPPEQRTITLDESLKSQRIKWFVAALRALIADLRKTQKGVRIVPLRGGVAVTIDGTETGYRFPYEGEADVFEGAKVTLVVGGRQAEGRIVAIDGHGLTLTADQDFGPEVESCQLRIDNTAMLEALADKLEKVASGQDKLNLALAEAVLTNAGTEELPGVVPAAAARQLNPLQRDAVARILTNEVTFLWGPPGTGKTQSLSVANQMLFDAGKRILICSNTNQAVDQVLLKLCRTLKAANHPALADGMVVRLGQLHLEALDQEFCDDVTVAGIAARKSESLQRRLTELDRDIARIRKSTESARAILSRFAAYDQHQQQVADVTKLCRDLQQEARTAAKRIDEGSLALRRFEDEYQAWRAAGTLKRLILRKEVAILADLQGARADREAAAAALPELEARLAEARSALPPLESRLDELRGELARLDRAAAQAVVDNAEKMLEPLLEEVAAIKAQLADLQKSIVKEARIIGATVTKSFLSPQTLGEFDVVIIDEASMVMLPALFYVAGLAKEKVVVSGDFRQLSPIVQTEEAAIREAIGADIFTAAGIAEAFRDGRKLKRTVMLAEQYRMADGICTLISPRMYDRRLVTAAGRKREAPMPPAPFDGELTIIDTTSIQPFTHLDGGSRFNLMNALAVRNLARFLKESGFAAEPGRLGVCTPYAAQAKLVGRLMESSGLADRVAVGTVHRYQGDEKAVMVIDIPDSFGEKWSVGLFAQAEMPDEDGAKLFNVAVSRCQDHLIFVGNLSYLDAKLPCNAFLRELLHIAQTRGRVVDVRDVLSLWPIAEDLQSRGHTLDIDPETLKSGVFRQTDFDAVFAADLQAACQGVAIFSGFITPQRVATYERLFRLKAAEGVPVRCVTRPPQRNGNMAPDLGEAALAALEAMGCAVDTRWDMHEKLAIIDDEIVWVGSLNPLSHSGKTDEMMLRFTGRAAALQLAAFMAVTGGGNPDKAAGTLYAGENPPCPKGCGRTTLRKGKHGPFWQCESECGWTQSVGRAWNRPPPNVQQSPPPEKDDSPPPCPNCGKPTIRRDGRFGPFWGCPDYPRCKGIVKNR